MTTNKILFRVRGIKPAPWGTNEWQWRNAVAIEARNQRRNSVNSHRFEVSIVFYLLHPTLERADLDNLAKPVLDTIFLSNYPQVKDRSLTGALFEVDDSFVHKLTLEKMLVKTAEEEGAEIAVFWEE